MYDELKSMLFGHDDLILSNHNSDDNPTWVLSPSHDENAGLLLGKNDVCVARLEEVLGFNGLSALYEPDFAGYCTVEELRDWVTF